MTETGFWDPLVNEVGGRSILRSIMVNSEVKFSKTGTKLRLNVSKTGTKLSKTVLKVS